MLAPYAVELAEKFPRLRTRAAAVYLPQVRVLVRLPERRLLPLTPFF